MGRKTCPTCFSKFAKSKLRQHVEAVHGLVGCPACSSQFMDKHAMEQHYGSVHRTGGFRHCVWCGFKVKTVKGLNSHFKIHRENPSTSVTPLVATIQGFAPIPAVTPSSPSPQLVREGTMSSSIPWAPQEPPAYDYREATMRSELVTCALCDIRVPVITLHYSVMHRNLFCRHCGAIFNDDDATETHYRDATKCAVCTLCSISFWTWNEYRQHMTTDHIAKHAEAAYCAPCNKYYRTTAVLIEHVNAVHGGGTILKDFHRNMYIEHLETEQVRPHTTSSKPAVTQAQAGNIGAVTKAAQDRVPEHHSYDVEDNEPLTIPGMSQTTQVDDGDDSLSGISSPVNYESSDVSVTDSDETASCGPYYRDYLTTTVLAEPVDAIHSGNTIPKISYPIGGIEADQGATQLSLDMKSVTLEASIDDIGPETEVAQGAIPEEDNAGDTRDKDTPTIGTSQTAPADDEECSLSEVSSVVSYESWSVVGTSDELKLFRGSENQDIAPGEPPNEGKLGFERKMEYSMSGGGVPGPCEDDSGISKAEVEKLSGLQQAPASGNTDEAREGPQGTEDTRSSSVLGDPPVASIATGAPDPCVAPGLQRTTAASFTCKLCQQMPLDPTITICGHMFCHRCIMAELSKTLCCPVCAKVMFVRLAT